MLVLSALLFAAVSFIGYMLSTLFLPDHYNTDGLHYVPIALAMADVVVFAMVMGRGNFLRRFFLFKASKLLVSLGMMLVVLLLSDCSVKAVAVTFVCCYMLLLLPETAAILFIGKNKKTA